MTMQQDTQQKNYRANECSNCKFTNKCDRIGFIGNITDGHCEPHLLEKVQSTLFEKEYLGEFIDEETVLDGAAQ